MRPHTGFLVTALCPALLTAAADAGLLPVLRASLYRGASTRAILCIDFGIVLAASIVGWFLARRGSFPVWWREQETSAAPRQLVLGLLLAVVVVVGNTLIWFAARGRIAALAPWVGLVTPPTAILLACRGALTENVVFRFFLFPLVSLAVIRGGCPQPATLVLGALVSSAAFALIHPGLMVAFLAGLALVYLYCRYGLLAALVVQFVGDAVPFVLLSHSPRA